MQKERASKRPVGSAGAITDTLPRKFRTALELSGVLSGSVAASAVGFVAAGGSFAA
jgi:hypothetical protein